jgi:hypothetical protein
MIVFALQCAHNHRFEGWFASGDDFDDQQRRGLLTCPSCGESHVSKLLTAKIGRSDTASRDRGRDAPVTEKTEAPVGLPDPQQVRALVEHMLANTEDVGKRFADEARRIHRGDAPERGIRGSASAEEVTELLDEGVPVLPLPVPPREDWH